MSGTKLVLAADIGGTHITAAVIDMVERRIVPSSLTCMALNANGTANEIIDVWSTALLNAKGNSNVTKVCLAMPGPFDYQRGISHMKGQGKYDALFGSDVRELLSDSLKVSPGCLLFENDAACYLQGEVFAGAASGRDDEKVIGVTLGTGLGTAIYENGRSHSADLWCLPFMGSTAEEHLATRWFLNRYFELTGSKVSGVKELAAIAAADDNAKTVFSEFGRNLALFLHEFGQLQNPQAVVIGGNIAKAYPLFGKPLETELAKLHSTFDLKVSTLGEQAAVLGAAGSWMSSLQNQPAHSD